MTIANICLPLGLALLGIGVAFLWKERGGDSEGFFFFGAVLIIVALLALPVR